MDNMSSLSESKISVLVVDDDKDDRVLFTTYINSAFNNDVLISTCDSIGGALSILEARDYDCILLDYELEDGKADDFLKSYVNESSKLNAIIIVTARGKESLVPTLMHLGAIDYIPKDEITKKRLFHVIENAIRIQSKRNSELEIKREILRSNEELSHFASMISHDLRNPVGTILGYCDILRNSEEYQNTNSDNQEVLTKIHNISEKILVFMYDLLEFSSIRLRKADFCEIQCSAVVESVVEDHQHVLDEIGGEVKISEIPPFYSIPVKLKQLFQNLLSNSIKYRKEDTPLRVEVSGKVVDSHVQITFEDNGIGFEQKYADIIFEPLRRLKVTQNTHEGNGIGLATCKKIVLQHGGTIEAQSSLGTGCKFVMTFPSIS